MGFAASQARLLILTAYKSDLEFQGQTINQIRMAIANSTGELFTLSANLDPNSPQARQIQASLASVQALDKSLELQLRRLDSQRSAAETELQSVQKVLQKNIQGSFNAFSQQG